MPKRPSSLFSRMSKRDLIAAADDQARLIRMLDVRVNERDTEIRSLMAQLEAKDAVNTFFHGPSLSPLASQNGRGVARSRKRG